MVDQAANWLLDVVKVHARRRELRLASDELRSRFQGFRNDLPTTDPNQLRDRVVRVFEGQPLLKEKLGFGRSTSAWFLPLDHRLTTRGAILIPAKTHADIGYGGGGGTVIDTWKRSDQSIADVIMAVGTSF